MPGLERGLIHAAQPRRLAYRIDPLRPKRIAVFELSPPESRQATQPRPQRPGIPGPPYLE